MGEMRSSSNDQRDVHVSGPLGNCRVGSALVVVLGDASVTFGVGYGVIYID